MLPARNAAHHLEAHLAAVARYADLVVALDDGSTDDTRAVLESHPLVKVVLTNPRRDRYAGWDDAANRARLLEATLELGASWAMSLDADELMDPDDADALGRFVRGEADPTRAYLFPVYRMIVDLAHTWGPPLWVGRLFAPRPGHTLPSERLHFVPVPTQIPRDRWVRTTLRIQHLGGLTAEDRHRRLAKYDDADPDRRWQESYDHLVDEPARSRPWPGRGRLLPVVAHEPVVDDAPLGSDEPTMSVVIISRDEERLIDRAVKAALAQDTDEHYEVIVVTSGSDDTVSRVRQTYPDVAVVDLGPSVLPGAARNAGVAASNGRWITFPGSHVELRPDTVAKRVAAHRMGWPMVTDTMLNGTQTKAGWASWFLDNAGLLPDQPSRAIEGPPSRCSYHRSLLAEVGGFPEDRRTGEDSVVNEELFARGYGAWWAADCVTVHHTPCETVSILIRHHAKRGRGRAQMLLDAMELGEQTPRQVASGAARWLPGRLRWTHSQVRGADREIRARYRRSVSLVAAGATAAWVGCWVELIRGGLVQRLVASSRPRATRWR